MLAGKRVKKLLPSCFQFLYEFSSNISNKCFSLTIGRMYNKYQYHILKEFIFMYFFTTVNNNKIIYIYEVFYVIVLTIFCSPTFGSWTNRQ